MTFDTDMRAGEPLLFSTTVSGLAVRENVLLHSNMDTGTISMLELDTRQDYGALVSDLQAPGSLLMHHPGSYEGEIENEVKRSFLQLII